MRGRNKLGKGVLLAAAMLAAACSASPVRMDWYPHGGSKAEGVIRLGIIWNPQHDEPLTDPLQAEELAMQKCRAWGYERAESLGPITTTCTRRSTDILSTCTRKVAEIAFRCVGAPL